MITLYVYGEVHKRPQVELDFSCKWAHNPHHDRRLRQLTGLHKEVIEEVREAPKYNVHISAITKHIMTLGAQNVGIHCHAGRHRSVVVANDVADSLRVHGYTVEIEYLNPVIREMRSDLQNAKKPKRKS